MINKIYVGIHFKLRTIKKLILSFLRSTSLKWYMKN